MLCAACGESIQATGIDRCPHCSSPPLLDGRYRLLDALGHGSAGTTYRALRIDDGAVVAVKELPLARAASEKARQLLAREARVLRELDHPAIPGLLDDFDLGAGKQRHYYIVQQHIEGVTLAEEADGRRYSQDEVLDILVDLLGILDYLHGLSPPVIHRDLKPTNVLRRPDGSLALVDFGSVRDALRDAELGGSTVAGTFGYMAPEQFMGEATPATDLYGLGALAVALLTRRSPQTLLDHAGRIVWEPHVQLHPATIRLLRRLLAPAPTRRTPSARVALDDIARARTDRARSPGLLSRPEPLPARGRTAVAERTGLALLDEPPRLPRARDPAGLSESPRDPLDAVRDYLMSNVQGVFLVCSLLILSGVALNLAGRTASSARSARVAAAGLSVDAGNLLLAQDFVRDPGVLGCLEAWRSGGASPGDPMLAVAVEQAPGGAPAVFLDAGELAGTPVAGCLAAAGGAVHWTELPPRQHYHAKFGLPIWDAPEPLQPWPAYSKPPMSEESELH
jgi:serine/threonine protein kinase